MNRYKLLMIVFFLTVIAVLGTLYANAQQWKPNPKYIKSAKDTTGKAQRMQYLCQGTTQKGKQCKRHVSGPNMFCYQHDYQK